MIWFLLIILGGGLVGVGLYRLWTRPLRYRDHPFDRYLHQDRVRPNQYARKRP